MSEWKEKELEDYVVDHLDDVFSLITENPHVTLLGRQVRCRYGIIDILAFQGSTLFVIELKAVKADDNTAGQLQRYRHAIDRVGLPEHFTLELLDTFPILCDFPISLVVIAPAFTDKAVYGVDLCFKATKTDTGFAFAWEHGPKGDKKASATLMSTLRPYFDSLLHTQQQLFLRDSDGILTRSAARRMLDVN
jgi:hypothetical protein